jgi:hypothetical protein
MDFQEVAAGGDRLATLRSFRNMLAADIEGCDSRRDVAALGRLFVDVLDRIDAVDGGVKTSEDSTFDELARRRAERAANPAGGDSSAGSEPG